MGRTMERITEMLGRVRAARAEGTSAQEVMDAMHAERRAEEEAARRLWVFDVRGPDEARTYTSPYLGDALKHQIEGGSITPRRVNAGQYSTILRKL